MQDPTTIYLNPYVIFFSIIFLIVFVFSIIFLIVFARYMLKPRKPMSAEQQQSIATQRERLEMDYREWMMQADIYFDAEDFSGAFGAASMAAAKAQQLAELKKG